MRITCVYYQSRLAFLSQGENVPQLSFGQIETGRLMIRGEHRQGQVKNNHHGVFAFLNGLRELFPHRAGHGENAQYPGKAQKQEGGPLRGILASVKQKREQRFIDCPVPGCYSGIYPPQGKDECCHRNESQEPQRSEELEILDQIGRDEDFHQALLPSGLGAESSSACTRARPASASQGIENRARMKLMIRAAPSGQ